jgi:hypothetical protein
MRIASRLRRMARRLCYLDRPRTRLKTCGTAEFWRRRGKRRPAVRRAPGQEMIAREFSSQTARRFRGHHFLRQRDGRRRSQGRAHLWPDLSRYRPTPKTDRNRPLLGFEDATKGRGRSTGARSSSLLRTIRGNSDLAQSALAEAYDDEGADIAVGTNSSRDNCDTACGRGTRRCSSTNRRSPTRSPAPSTAQFIPG